MLVDIFLFFGIDTIATYDTVELAYVLLGDGSNATYAFTSQNVLQGFGEITPGRQIDFRVQALTGSYIPNDNSTFTGEAGDWSPIQTITISASSTPVSTSPTPTVPEFPLIAIPLLLSLLTVAVILTQKKPKNLT
jgi:hypothetical protein